MAHFLNGHITQHRISGFSFVLIKEIDFPFLAAFERHSDIPVVNLEDIYFRKQKSLIFLEEYYKTCIVPSLDHFGPHWRPKGVKMHIFVCQRKTLRFCFYFQPIVLSLSDDVKSSMMSELKTKDLSFVRVTAHKPAYEVGSSSQLKLSFGKKKTGLYLFIQSTCSCKNKNPYQFLNSMSVLKIRRTAAYV